MRDTRSKAIVREMMQGDAEVRRDGFASAMRRLCDSASLYAAARAILPDAYRIADDEVILYEVADTNPIRPAKAQHIAELADEVDEIEMLLRVIVIDYTGHVIADTPGWAYGSSHTADYAPNHCMDMTPAARAAYMDARS